MHKQRRRCPVRCSPLQRQSADVAGCQPDRRPGLASSHGQVHRACHRPIRRRPNSRAIRNCEPTDFAALLAAGWAARRRCSAASPSSRSPPRSRRLRTPTRPSASAMPWPRPPRTLAATLDTTAGTSSQTNQQPMIASCDACLSAYTYTCMRKVATAATIIRTTSRIFLSQAAPGPGCRAVRHRQQGTRPLRPGGRCTEVKALCNALVDTLSSRHSNVA